MNIKVDEPFKLSCTSGLNWVEITIPIRTVSEANCTDHWRVKHKRHKKQKALIYMLLRPKRPLLKVPCHINITRYAPRKLDKHDNLPISVKYLLDACCEVITNDYRPGRADSDERIEVAYNQVISKHYAVKIHFLMPDSVPFGADGFGI